MLIVLVLDVVKWLKRDWNQFWHNSVCNCVYWYMSRTSWTRCLLNGMGRRILHRSGDGKIPRQNCSNSNQERQGMNLFALGTHALNKVVHHPYFPRMESRYQNLPFFAEIATKNHLKSATKFRCLKSCSSKILAQSTTYRMVSTFWQGMILFP